MSERNVLPIGQLELERSGASPVKLEAALIAGGDTGLKITSPHAVEAVGTFTGSHKLKVNINGTEYWIELDAV